jgi:hypothetical protein
LYGLWSGIGEERKGGIFILPNGDLSLKNDMKTALLILLK